MALPAPRPNIDTCTSCGKLFPRVSLRLCSQCGVVEEHRFQLVRGYVLEHDGASVGEIASETGVRAAEVRRFLERGRLVELAEATSCTCGGVGERCRYCRSRLSSAFRDMEQSMRRSVEPDAGEHGQERISYVRRARRLGGEQS